MLDVDLSAPPAEIQVADRYRKVLLLFRQNGTPVARDELSVEAGKLPAEVYEQALDEARRASPPPPAQEDRSPALPSATVVVCTHGRGDAALATVASFEALDYDGAVEIIVVDNAPKDDLLAKALAVRPQHPRRPVRRVVAPIPGLTRARNCALMAASGELIAFTDDDAIVDSQWLRMIAAGFASAPDVVCVTGLTVPVELETRAQDWAEMFNGLNRGRSFTRTAYRLGELGGRHPLYPYPTLGAGVNMAFKRDVVKALGGFCTALGPGTPSAGGEETAMLAEILLARKAIVYEPAALVRHEHRRDEEGLCRQMRSYGVGTTAYLVWCLHHHPVASLGLARMAGPALRYFRTRGASHQDADRGPAPGFLTAELRRGMRSGPRAYLRSVIADRRLRRSPTQTSCE